jgi:hypothetical protein
MSEGQLKVFLAEWWRDVDQKYRDDLKRDMIIFWKERDNILRLKMDTHDVKEHVLDRLRDYDTTIKVGLHNYSVSLLLTFFVYSLAFVCVGG